MAHRSPAAGHTRPTKHALGRVLSPPDDEPDQIRTSAVALSRPGPLGGCIKLKCRDGKLTFTSKTQPAGYRADHRSCRSPTILHVHLNMQFNIRQLTDVSGCNLPQHLSCNLARARHTCSDLRGIAAREHPNPGLLPICP
jgi:hypothetical protein